MPNLSGFRIQQVTSPSTVSVCLVHLLPCAGMCNTSFVFPFLQCPCPFFSLLGLSTIGIDFLRIRRIKHHLNFITMDDKLLSQNDAGKILSNQELKEALEERGLYVHFILIIILRRPSLRFLV